MELTVCVLSQDVIVVSAKINVQNLDITNTFLLLLIGFVRGSSHRNSTITSKRLSRHVNVAAGYHRATYSFVKTHEKPNDEKRALVQNKLSGSLESILDLVPGCKSSVLGMLLETLTTIITVLLLQNKM
uniref:Uncharacterized protein n=1 Tax=Glossina palpalis gambiensis TaxID=67801 RepID=A0A1B0BXD1_9MUSC